MTIFASNLSYQCLCRNLESGEVRNQDVIVHYDDAEFALRRSRAKGQDTTFFVRTSGLDRMVRVQTSCLLI